jgi:hypothetical protein
MKGLKYHLDFLIVVLVIASFVAVASQRLGTVPVPEGDEAFTLQVPYEMLNHGKLALPMLRYLGGNIENSWHSYIPVFFVIMTAYHKVFGFGLAEGRAFNLMTASLTLLMLYLIGRKLFDWRAGLIAVVLLIGDQTFFERSRLVRDDYAAATFALLAFFLYELAEERKKSWLYIASGLSAGAGVMCHTNMLYMVGAVGLLILLRDGWRAFTSSKLYLFSLSALAVMSYELIYDILDYKDFVLQNRGDDLHFRLMEKSGLWQNLLEEQVRYLKWFTGGLMFPDIPQTTLIIFQVLTPIAVLYLIISLARKLRGGNLISDPRARVLLVTIVVTLFHALIVSQKRIFYFAHLAPWFALCVAVMLRDGSDQLRRLRNRSNFAYRAAVATCVVTGLVYVSCLVRQNFLFVKNVRNPELATFAEFTTVIRNIVPEELCPVAVQNPSMWLSFQEKDRCFAQLEKRMNDVIDIDGKDYALIRRNKRGGDAAETSEEGYHLLGEMSNTQYGNIVVYYTGTDPRFLTLAPKRYRFFGELRGFSPETN